MQGGRGNGAVKPDFKGWVLVAAVRAGTSPSLVLRAEAGVSRRNRGGRGVTAEGWQPTGLWPGIGTLDGVAARGVPVFDDPQLVDVRGLGDGRGRWQRPLQAGGGRRVGLA